MSMLHINWKPADRQLRQFGLIALVAFPLLGWIWARENHLLLGILGGLGVLCGLLGMVHPRALKPLFIGLTCVTLPIGLVVAELAMLVIYGGLFVTIGGFFRLTKRDGLQLRLDPDASTYWQEKKQPDSAARYYRQS